MSALQVLIDGFLTAAELVALLFVSPVSAMDQPRTERGRARRLSNASATRTCCRVHSTYGCLARWRTCA